MAPLSTFVAALALAYGLCGTLTAAHPGEPHKDGRIISREMKRAADIAEYQKRQLDLCMDKKHARELNERAVTRRQATAEKLRAERGLSDSK
jgi:hypothetical protein